MKKLNTALATVSMIILLLGCDSSIIPGTSEKTKTWVYIEIETTMLTDTTDYYYYGRIDKILTDKITSGEIKQTYFVLSDIRFWNSDDLLEVYENDSRFGFKVFRTEDIQYLTFFKKDPVQIFGEDELHPSALSVSKQITGSTQK